MANADKIEEATATAVENVVSDTDRARIQEAEHGLNLRRILRHHPALVWWSFYWAMAGVAW